MKKFSPLKGVISKTAVATETAATNGSVPNGESAAITDCAMQGFQSFNEKVFGKLQVLLNNYIAQCP
jgi:hypothetical protein